MVYYRNRYYHPQLGRFVTRDPFLDEVGPIIYRRVDTLIMELVHRDGKLVYGAQAVDVDILEITLDGLDCRLVPVEDRASSPHLRLVKSELEEGMKEKMITSPNDTELAHR